MEKILHTECDCLFANDVFDDNCRKRWFSVNDIENSKQFYLGVCNEHLRLKINNKLNRNKSDYRYCVSAKKSFWIYSDLVEKIIGSHIKAESCDYRNSGNDLSDLYVSVQICPRPFISRRIKLLDAIEIYLRTNGWEIRELIFNEITRYLESKDIYKKYKTKYEKTMILLRKMKNTYGDNKEDNINQIFLNILEINIKTKQYDTNKQ